MILKTYRTIENIIKINFFWINVINLSKKMKLKSLKIKASTNNEEQHSFKNISFVFKIRVHRWH